MVEERPTRFDGVFRGLSGGTLSGSLSMEPAKTFSLGYGQDWVFTITWSDGWHIEVNQGVEWDAAAKQFWNAVARMVGQEPPFGW
jgi:hypothetical protein